MNTRSLLARSICYLFLYLFLKIIFYKIYLLKKKNEMYISNTNGQLSKSVKTTVYFQGPETVHVSKFYKEGREGKFLSNISPEAKTLYETFRKGAKISSKIHFLM